MIITLDLFWKGAILNSDEEAEWAGTSDLDEVSAVDAAYADVIGKQMDEDFGHLIGLNEALEFCGTMSVGYTRPTVYPVVFQMALDLRLQDQAHRALFVLPPTSIDNLAERIGNPGYHMTGDIRLALSQRPDAKSPYRRTRSRHVVVRWSKGKSGDVALHFPVLFPFDEQLTSTVVYTSWMDLATALSVLIERRKRMRMA